MMNKTIPIIIVILFFSVISLLLIYPQFEDNRKQNLEWSIREPDRSNPEYNDSPKKLELVLESCECQDDPERGCFVPLIKWQNQTHYIDNNECEFIALKIIENTQK